MQTGDRGITIIRKLGKCGFYKTEDIYKYIYIYINIYIYIYIYICTEVYVNGIL